MTVLIILNLTTFKFLFKSCPAIFHNEVVKKGAADYNLFKLAYKIIINKEHISKEGLFKLISIKGSLSRGLSSELQSAFPSRSDGITKLLL